MDMLYYDDGTLRIRQLMSGDPEVFAKGEREQGWINASPDKLNKRLKDASDGCCVNLCAEYLGEPAGYVSLYTERKGGAFADTPIPEIVDFNVLEKFRNRGIGSRLMDAAESVAAEISDRVYLGVGLHSGYGAAQRMYVKRGYIPDGSGVWYNDRPLAPYAPCNNDDDLVLYLSKQL